MKLLTKLTITSIVAISTIKQYFEAEKRLDTRPLSFRKPTYITTLTEEERFVNLQNFLNEVNKETVRSFGLKG